MSDSLPFLPFSAARLRVRLARCALKTPAFFAPLSALYAMPRDLHSTLETLRRLGGEASDEATKSQLRSVERMVLKLARQLDHEKRRGAVQVQALRSELQDELIAREANAARIAERQRSAFELPTALPNALHGYDRAYASTALIEVAVRSLDFHAVKNIGETETLVADVSARR